MTRSPREVFSTAAAITVETSEDADDVPFEAYELMEWKRSSKKRIDELNADFNMVHPALFRTIPGSSVSFYFR